MKVNTKITILIVLGALAMTLPFIGLTDFHTKGEPREAVVSQSMLATGDWVLPTNNGGEIPYKPMMFHWLGAAAGLINGGTVNEFTARFPSALCFSLMVGATFWFYSRTSRRKALLTVLLTFTAFELHRAAMNARVDMVLTMFIVLAIYFLYDWWRNGMKSFPLSAILMMTGGTLTKGPVGMLLPCLAIGLFLLLKGVNFFKAFGWLFLWGLLSLLVPALWYWGAYERGGESFLNLAMEENFGRMTDSMSYVVHENPWWYNIVSLLAGFIPWTVNFLFLLFVAAPRLKRLRVQSFPGIKNLFQRIRNVDSVTLLSWVSFIVILVFYTIPSSKRSVYLMPLYPFLAFILSGVIEWQTEKARKSGVAFVNLLAGLSVAVGLVLIALWCGVVPDSLFHDRHAAENNAMVSALSSPGISGYVLGLLPMVCGLIWFFRRMLPGFRTEAWGWCKGATVLILLLYISFDGAILPPVLNSKSVKEETMAIDRRFPREKGEMYEFISWSDLGNGNPIHFFETDFYMNDRIRNFKKEMPEEGYVIVCQIDSTYFMNWQQERGLKAEVVTSLKKPLLKQRAYVIQIGK